MEACGIVDIPLEKKKKDSKHIPSQGTMLKLSGPSGVP